ncbi:MAG: hypothetical protein IKO75_08830 [Bacteroidales bacterium]|nr:hypothetical protein [Bacteroidales bacterium]
MDLESLSAITGGIVFLIGVCVVLPLTIVWLVNKRKNHEIDKKTEILMALMEKKPNIDPAEVLNKLNMSQETNNKTLKQKLLENLYGGLMMTLMGLVILVLHLMGMVSFGSKAIGLFCGGVIMAIGLAFLIYYFVSKRVLRNELEAEEKRIAEQKISE